MCQSLLIYDFNTFTLEYYGTAIVDKAMTKNTQIYFLFEATESVKLCYKYRT